MQTPTESQPIYGVGAFVTLYEKALPCESGNSAELLRAYLLKACSENGIEIISGESGRPFMVIAFGNRAFCFGLVHQHGPALAVIKSAFSELGLENQTQIAWFNCAEEIWQDWWPREPRAPFHALYEEVMQWGTEKARVMELFGQILTRAQSTLPRIESSASTPPAL